MLKYKLSDDTLRRLYWQEKLSSLSIAERLGISHSTVLRCMKKYSIPRRSYGKSFKPPKIPIGKLKSTELAYLAGIIDGEGSMRLGQKGVHIEIGNSNKKLVDYLSGLLNSEPKIANTSGSKAKKVFYKVNIHRTIDVVNLLKALMPYLIVKQEKVLNWYAEV
jgi:hypothetical protein